MRYITQRQIEIILPDFHDQVFFAIWCAGRVMKLNPHPSVRATIIATVTVWRNPTEETIGGILL
jgi:hypothetical protein